MSDIESRLDDIERKLDRIMKHLKLDSEPVGDLDDYTLMEVRDLVRAKKKIEAIKVVRMRTGWGLKEAKEYVDRLG